MGRKKKEGPITFSPNEPLWKCYDCIHWHRCKHPNDRFADDFSTGSCDRYGYSKVPPLFSCNGWESGNGKVYDKIKKY